MKVLLPVLVFLGTIFASCEYDEDPEDIKIYYSTGNLYCEGAYRILYKRDDCTFCVRLKHKFQIGDWKFYHPNGSLSLISIYDNNGKPLNLKSYSDDGEIEKISVTIYSGKSILYSHKEFFDEGRLYKEVHYRFPRKGDGLSVHKEIIYYHDNGKIKERYEYVDGKLSGLNKEWNKEVDLLLTVEYENGLIIQPKKK